MHRRRIIRLLLIGGLLLAAGCGQNDTDPIYTRGDSVALTQWNQPVDVNDASTTTIEFADQIQGPESRRETKAAATSDSRPVGIPVSKPTELPQKLSDGRERAVQVASVEVGNEESETVHPAIGETFVDAEKLFADWEVPEIALFITGRQHGYIEPCGCTGLERAKGGLSRRFAFRHEMQKRNWPMVTLDVGNQVRRIGQQAELKFQTTADVMRLMNYQAIGLGPDDLRLGLFLLTVIAGVDDRPSPYISANVSSDLLDNQIAYRVIKVGRRRVGVTAVLGKGYLPRAQGSSEIQLGDPEPALARVAAALKQQKCDILIMLAHASLDETRDLAKKFPQFPIVVTAGGDGEPTQEAERIGGSRIIQVGTKGMYAGIVGLYTRKPLRYQRVPLDASFSDSKQVMERFANYQKNLKLRGLDGLEVKPRKHPSGHKFVGHEVCGECHTTAYEIFEGTPHFAATESIFKPTERSEIPRHHDPECLSCHVTGWNPQEFVPYESGYLDLKKSLNLHSNGCENCHGPGSAHVAAENGDADVSDEELQELRAGMRITLEQARMTKCFECHDPDNDPDFSEEGAFEKYWEQVKHYGKD